MTTYTAHQHLNRSPSKARAARKLGAVTAAVAAIGASAYGAFHYMGPGTPSRASAGTRPASAGTRPALPIGERVITAGMLPGFVRTADPAVVRDPHNWAAKVEQAPNATRETDWLRRIGFVAGVDQRLHGRYPLMAEAISVVEQYRSAAGARAELIHQYRQAARGSTRVWNLGIPGATGWQVTLPHRAALNVAFTDGRFYYLVGGAFTAHSTSTRAEILRAAGTVYLLVNGCTAHNLGS